MISVVVAILVFAGVITLAIVGFIAWWIVAAIFIAGAAIATLFGALFVYVLGRALSIADKRDEAYAEPFGDVPKVAS